MNKRIVSWWTSLLLVFMLMIPAWVGAEGKDNRINYLALGDSLAAGQLSDKSKPIDENGYGKGYADFLAQQLDELDVLGNYNKNFAKSGHTITGIVEDIGSNIEIDNVSIQSAIAEADIITLSAGVNDILKLIDRSDFSYDEAELEAGLQKVGEDLGKTLMQITNLNSDAKVYIMGYYNAFPYVPESIQKEKIIPLLTILNGIINEVAQPFGATFVPTEAAIDKSIKTYIDNPEDIHPNELGYQVLANEFWKRINLGEEVEFTDKLPKWAKDDIHYLVKKGIIKGYDNGEFGANDEIKRLHAAFMLKRSIILDFKDAENPNFNDFSSEDLGFKAVAKLKEYGIFEGDDKGNFNPEKSLTRAEMAKITVEAFGLEGDTDHTFSDVPENHWANDYISILEANDIVNGYVDGTYKPNQNITRAEFAKIIAKALNK